jgi:phytoene dehydrogenase-like protein
LFDLCTSDARAILERWFESDIIRSALLPDSAIGAMNLSGLILVLHQCMGEAGGARGIWGYHRGGMGGMAEALANAGKEYGVTITTGEAVESIRVTRGGTACGIELESGEVVPADVVVSNATPHETFLCMVPSGHCPPAFVRRVRGDDYASGVMKVNAILRGLPVFNALRGSSDPAHYLKGTIHLSPSTSYIENALADAHFGVPSVRPMVEMTIPSIVDNTLAPPGYHVMNMLVQFVPYHPNGGEWDNDRKQKYFEQNILAVVRSFVSNIDDIFIGAEVLSPADMERDIRLTGGNIFHGAMTPDRLFCFRHPYRTPVKNLWLCGAGTHPGGGVTGACGHNAAHEIIRSLA